MQLGGEDDCSVKRGGVTGVNLEPLLSPPPAPLKRQIGFHEK